jgi:hypothetical protein
MFEYSILEVNADTNTIRSKVPDNITLHDHVLVLNYKNDWYMCINNSYCFRFFGNSEFNE